MKMSCDYVIGYFLLQFIMTIEDKKKKKKNEWKNHWQCANLLSSATFSASMKNRDWHRDPLVLSKQLKVMTKVTVTYEITKVR